MKLILAPRGGGKTTELIRIASERGGYIVCTNHREAYRITREAEAMGLNIHFPITVQELKNRRGFGPGVQEFYVDNALLILQELLEVPVAVATESVDDPGLEIKFLPRHVF